MNEPERREESTEDAAEQNPRGPSLTLLYSLVALALIAAMAIATMIVMPFYRRR